MSMERKAVVFYRNFYEAIKDLPVDLKAEVYDAVMEYGLNGTEPSNLSLMAKSIFALIKPSIDTNNTRYENGKHGGRPRRSSQQSESEPNENEIKPNENQTETKHKPINNINNEYENDNNIIIQEAELPMLVPEVVVEKVDYAKIVKLYNDILGGVLPKVTIISDARKNAIRSIFNKHGPDAIELVFRKVYNSGFIRDEIEKGKKWCSFDWVMKSSNFIKILEGNYDGSNRTNSISEKGRANEAALEGYLASREPEQNMACQVERPF